MPCQPDGPLVGDSDAHFLVRRNGAELDGRVLDAAGQAERSHDQQASDRFQHIDILVKKRPGSGLPGRSPVRRGTNGRLLRDAAVSYLPTRRRCRRTASPAGRG